MMEELANPDGPEDEVFVLVLVLLLQDFTPVPRDLVGRGLLDSPVPVTTDLVEYGSVE